MSSDFPNVVPSHRPTTRVTAQGVNKPLREMTSRILAAFTLELCCAVRGGVKVEYCEVVWGGVGR